MRYFFDHCISFRYAEALRALEVDSVALKEEISPRSTDEQIFKYLANSDRVFVTADRGQLLKVAEAKELKSAGISAIYFAKFWGNLDFWQQAGWLVRRWPLIDGVQQGLARGTIVELKENGKSLLIPV